MPNAEDRRVKMTKKILKEALIDSMHTKPLHEISIKRLCELADINRSTFYHHYDSPVDLYNDIINDISKDVNQIIGKHRSLRSSNTDVIAEMLTYAENNRELFLVLLSDMGNISIGERLTRIVGNFIGYESGTELSMYCAQFISAGVANILWLWLNKENRLPPKEVAGLITTIMMQGVKRAVLFSEKDNILNNDFHPKKEQ